MLSSKLKACLLTLSLCSFFLFTGCDDDDPEISGFLKNGNAEIGSTRANNWFFSTGNDRYEVEWTDKESYSPDKSLSISTETVEPTEFAYWGQSFSTDLPYGESVTLRVWVKGNLSGTGISIVIRGDDTVQPDGFAEQFVSTEGVSPISGNFDWTEYSVTLDNVDSSTKSLTVYMVYLQDTTGEVYFDDILLF